MESQALEMYTQDLAEIEKLISLSSRVNIKRHLEQIRANVANLMNEEKKKFEKSKESEKINNSNVQEQSQLSFISVNKYALESGDKFAKIYLTDGFSKAKELPKESIISKFNKKSFEIQILNLEKKNFKFACANLSKEIDPETSYVKATNSGLTIFLKKAQSSDHWDTLEYKKPIIGDKSEKKPKDKDPNAGLMDMMKEMYQNGDPEMKRIIAESFSKAQSGETNKKMDKMGMGDLGDMANMSKMFGNMGDMGGMGGFPGFGNK
jgi:calcyclin binding protein